MTRKRGCLKMEISIRFETTSFDFHTIPSFIKGKNNLKPD